MKKITFLLIAVSLVFGMAACRSTQPIEITVEMAEEVPVVEAPIIEAVEEPVPVIDWIGVYSGTIPAASSPGIRVEITLNADQSFVARYAYIDRRDTIFTWVGTFTWDDKGSTIMLDYNDIPPYYRIGENILIQLDMQGNTVSGDLEDMYILKKRV